jgi:ubiquinone/menaquinone biosynthesis C-methylase UbiE
LRNLEGKLLINERLNQAGLIYGESAPRGGLNVSKRLDLLNRLHPLGGQVAVDLGCGKGSYTSELSRWYDVIMSIDILPENLTIARERLQSNGFRSIHFCCASGNALPIADESVDSVFMIEVLDHVPSLPLCLDEVFRILRPGGILYLTVPNRMFPWESHPVRFWGQYRGPGWFPFLPWFKLLHNRMATARVFSRRSLQEMCERAGLSAISMDAGYPPLERRGGSGLRSIMNWLETTPLRAFGLILAAAFSKPKRNSLRASGVTDRDYTKYKTQSHQYHRAFVQKGHVCAAS